MEPGGMTMLARLVIENFRSFRNRTVIDLTKTQYAALAETNTHNGLVKGLVLVGGNASGKSNILAAVRLLLDLLFLERQMDNPLLLCLFADSKEFSVEYVFRVDGHEIEYKIINNVEKEVLGEELVVDGKGVLYRMGSAARASIGGPEKQYAEKEVGAKTLFLRTLFFNTGFASDEVLKRWFQFLQNSVYYNAFERTPVSYGNKKLDAFRFLEGQGAREISDFFETHGMKQKIEYSKEVQTDRVRISFEEGKVPFFRREDCDIVIPYPEESLGNRLLLHFLPCYLTVMNSSGLLLVDEFSSGFHNDLEELLIREWMKTANDSQLIAVTHSTNLLSTSLLRPDQIYSVSFADREGSRVKRFSEEAPRVAQNLEKMYRSGVFGGIPAYELN